MDWSRIAENLTVGVVMFTFTASVGWLLTTIRGHKKDLDAAHRAIRKLEGKDNGR